MEYDRLAGEEAIIRTKESLERRGVNVIIVGSRQEALKKLEELLPEGVELMTGGSTTLDQIGFADFLIHNPEKYNKLKNAIFTERDPAKQSELRRRSNVAEYYIGSVHAVAETGQVVVASATGSQLGAYAYGAEHVVWVVGTQKITPTLRMPLGGWKSIVFRLRINA